MNTIRKLWLVFVIVFIQVIIEIIMLYLARRHGNLWFRINLKPDVEVL